MSSLEERPLERIKAMKEVLSPRGLEAGYYVPTLDCLGKASVDVRGQLHNYLRKQGLLDHPASVSGGGMEVRIPAWYVGADSLEEAEASMHWSGSSDDDLRIRLPRLLDYSEAGNALALFVHQGELYLANASEPAVIESAADPSSPLGRLLDKLSCARNRPIAGRFSAWNLRLLNSFFSEASEGEEVFLRVDKDVLDEIGQDLGGDAGFVRAVRSGPLWLTPSASLVERVLALERQRARVAKLQPDVTNAGPLAAAAGVQGYVDPGELDPRYRAHAAPAYLPYLAMLVRIAAADASKGFYKNLRETLGLTEQFGPPNMARLEAAWIDLQRWTAECHGRFGFFKLRRLGGYVHIGVPQSQSIVKPGDVQRMPLVFNRAEIRPDRELDGTDIARVLGEARAEASAGTFFSTSFQSALKTPAFDVPISSILRAIYEDWDGTLPDKRSQAATENETSTSRGVGLCLSLVQDDPLEFDIHWSLPAIHDSGSFELRHADEAWSGTYLGADGGLTKAGDAAQPEAWRLAENSFSDHVVLELVSQLGDETEEIIEEVTLAKHLLWIMVPGTGGPHGRPWLKERELPGYGTAFLLAPPGNVDRLQGYLERLQPDHDIVEAEGLPQGWMLVRLNECSELTDDQRTLPDGAEVHRTPRLIRFVGGRSVRRGYGHMYLPYDLPDVEFDAPAKAVLKFPDGVGVAEDQPGLGDSAEASPMSQSVRRYKLKLLRSGSASYKFEALLDGEVIGRPAVLRISGTDGDLVESGQDFSLDSLGGAQPSSEGLSGLLPDWTVFELVGREQEDFAAVDARDLGTRIDGSRSSFGVEENFLDALAQSGAGAMDAGVARRLLGRLLADAGREDNPTFVLMELRSRGHLEIATNLKGQMARVHAVKPTIYQLPAEDAGCAIYGILGTLRLVHWEALASGGPGWRACLRRGGRERFDALRLLEETHRAMQFACSADGELGRRGFRLANFPALAIAKWCEGLEVVRQAALQNPMESIGRAADAAMRFHAGKGLFSAKPARLPHELWKTLDLDTGLGQVHYLVENEQRTNELRHSFMRDSRWGVWIALDAFARYVKEMTGWADVHPFPLSYQQSSRTIWLPARIGLPVALERALVLCAGASSEAFVLQGAPAASEANSLALYRAEDDGPKVQVSRVYEQMADGKWLAYRWVPQAVANAVAKKLGARLDIV